MEMVKEKLSIPSISWNWPCATESYISLPQFNFNLSVQDIERFWSGLSKSLSLSYEEKVRVISAVPTLSVYQVNELIKVFDQEQLEFDELLNGNSGFFSKSVGVSVIIWLMIWENYQLKTDDDGINVATQFLNIFHKGGSIAEFEKFKNNSYFWLGCIEELNRHDIKGLVDIGLNILEKTFNESNI